MRKSGHARALSPPYSEDHLFHVIPDIPPDISISKQIDTVECKIKQNVVQEFGTMWTTHVKDLVVHGKFLELLALGGSYLSWRNLTYNISRGIL